MSDILLTISLLVSGRQDTTERCLNSIQPLREQVSSELILVDTGCTEGFCRKLGEYTDQIIPFSWCDDFAEARNAGLNKARGEWFLFLDDDEWFEDVTPIVDFFASGEYHQYEQAVYKVRNYMNQEGTSYSDDWVSRMIKMEEDTHFEGKVHESLVPARGRCKRIDTFAHHYGYVFNSEKEQREHFDRNVRILRKLMEEEPQNMRWPLQLMQECASIKDGDLLYREAGKGIRLVEKEDRAFVNQCRGSFFTGVLLGLGLQGEYDRLEESAELFLQEPKNTCATICSVCYQAVQFLSESGKWEKVLPYCEKYCEAYEQLQKELRNEQEQIILESIVLVKDAITQEAGEKVTLLWARALGELGRSDEFPHQKALEITGALRRYVDGNGEFLSLPEDIWKLGEKGIISIEDIILQLPLSQWMVQVMVLETNKDLEEWDKIRKHLCLIKTKEDIRYHYFAMHDANAVLELDEEEHGYDMLCEQLSYFVTSNITYAKEVYTRKAFEGKMQMLPSSCRGAVLASGYFECEDRNWSKKLEVLRKAANAYPQMGKFVKALAKEIGEEQQRQARVADEAQRKLLEMAKQVKGQVNVLMEQGMYAEAYDIVRQLRQMIPDDEETIQLEKKLKKSFS